MDRDIHFVLFTLALSEILKRNIKTSAYLFSYITFLKKLDAFDQFSFAKHVKQVNKNLQQKQHAFYKSGCIILIMKIVSLLLDIIFLQGTEVIFKVALSLLSSQETLIMECESFENIVEFLKSTLPDMNTSEMEKIITQV